MIGAQLVRTSSHLLRDASSHLVSAVFIARSDINDFEGGAVRRVASQ
jgi:hypothetical protein